MTGDRPVEAKRRLQLILAEDDHGGSRGRFPGPDAHPLADLAEGSISRYTRSAHPAHIVVVPAPLGARAHDAGTGDLVWAYADLP